MPSSGIKRELESYHDEFTGEAIDEVKRGSFGEKYRSLDIFGIPVSLTHHGDTSYKTNFGSTFSIMAFLIVISFFIMKFTSFIT